MVITANGRVYQYGMVHKPISEADAAAGAASGRLVGVNADPRRRETLEHVMRWSTNKWAMAEEEVRFYCSCFCACLPERLALVLTRRVFVCVCAGRDVLRRARGAGLQHRRG